MPLKFHPAAIRAIWVDTPCDLVKQQAIARTTLLRLSRALFCPALPCPDTRRSSQASRIRPCVWLLPAEPKGQTEGGLIPKGQQRAAAPTSRCARIPRRADRATHAIVQRPARDGAAVARLPACH